jgi:hypothetical protein
MTTQICPVDRALLFGATEPAAWTSEPFETAEARFLGFAHTEEPDYAAIARSWDLIGLPGVVASVDAGGPPYGGSHRLATSHGVCRGNPADRGYYHNCPVVDDYLPLDADGTPRFAPVWDYMLTAPVVSEAGATPRPAGATMPIPRACCCGAGDARRCRRRWTRRTSRTASS